MFVTCKNLSQSKVTNNINSERETKTSAVLTVRQQAGVTSEFVCTQTPTLYINPSNWHDQWQNVYFASMTRRDDSPWGFVSASESLAACGRFSGSSPEQWRQDLLWREEWRSAKKNTQNKQPTNKHESETLTIPLVFEEAAGVFLLGPLLLQQRQQPLLLLTGAIHEVIPWLKEQQNEEVNFYTNICFIGGFYIWLQMQDNL